MEAEVKDDQFKAKDEEEAMKRKTLFQSREEYRQKRMKKIMEAKEKPESPTFEEVQAKPGYQDIKKRPMILKDEKLRASASKDDYI